MAKKSLTDLVVDRYVNLELFYRKQEPQANGCIFWTGVKNNIGYGFIGYRDIDATTGGPLSGKGGMMTTHRLQFMITHGRTPALRNVNHTCHSKLCLNPDHLVEGTQQQKMRDMRRDGINMGGRQTGVKVGSYNHKQTGREYKYTEAEIQFVRTAPLEEIAEFFGCSRIKAARKRWGFRRGYQWLPIPDDKD